MPLDDIPLDFNNPIDEKDTRPAAGQRRFQAHGDGSLYCSDIVLVWLAIEGEAQTYLQLVALFPGMFVPDARFEGIIFPIDIDDMQRLCSQGIDLLAAILYQWM